MGTRSSCIRDLRRSLSRTAERHSLKAISAADGKPLLGRGLRKGSRDSQAWSSQFALESVGPHYIRHKSITRGERFPIRFLF